MDSSKLRSPADNGFLLFGFPTYKNTMGQEHSVFSRETYMLDMRGVSTRESGGIKANTKLPKLHEPRANPPSRISDYNDERRHDHEYTRRVRPSTLQKLVK